MAWMLSWVAPARGDWQLISASRAAGASGSVGNDVDYFSDGSGDFTLDFGAWDFANGVNIKRPQGSVDGFATQSSVIGSNGISMSGSGDANISAGGGEFDFASGGGHSSLDVTFKIKSMQLLDINYSGGGFPAHVEPYFYLFSLGGGLMAAYGAGTVQEQFTLGPGTYVISAGISAGASSSFPGDSASALGGVSFSVTPIPIPEPTSAMLALIGCALLPFYVHRRTRRA